MSRNNEYGKNNEIERPKRECWEGFRVLEPINEYRPDTGITERIGHLWFCLRRFLPLKNPERLITGMDELYYQCDNCSECNREVLSWGNMMRYNKKATQLSKDFIADFVRKCLRNKLRHFTIGMESIPLSLNMQEINTRVLSSFEHNKLVKSHDGYNPKFYDPNLTTEPKQIDEIPF